MKYNPDKKEIVIDKELNNLDKFVMNFVSLLEEYVIVSGYVSILLGRSRATEDVDLLVPKISFENFERLWEKANEKNLECMNTSNVKEAYNMLNNHAIRFFRKGYPVPNMEFKMIKNDLDKYSYENKIRVIINDKIVFISPLEMQIAYKLFLAADGTKREVTSDKDIEDARHLYKLFGDKINKEELLLFVKQLNVEKKIELLK
jgi:hypothetical protein